MGNLPAEETVNQVQIGGVEVELAAAVQGEEDFEFWWNNRGQPVEEPNRRRGGISGVETIGDGEHRLYCKRQQGHLYRSLRYPLGRPTVLREANVIAALGRLGIAVPEVAYSGVRYDGGEWQGLLITQALTGYVGLDQWFADDHPRDRSVDDAVLQSLAKTLGRLHRRRWQHGCLYPKHLFVKVAPGKPTAEVSVVLLDLEKSRRRITSLVAARHDLRQLHRQWQHIPADEWLRFFNYYLTLVPSRHQATLRSLGLSSPGWQGIER